MTTEIKEPIVTARIAILRDPAPNVKPKWLLKKPAFSVGACRRQAPSVPSMGGVLQVEKYLTEVMTPTVAKRKA
jgi:hypothetical protein